MHWKYVGLRLNEIQKKYNKDMSTKYERRKHHILYSFSILDTFRNKKSHSEEQLLLW